MPQQWSESIGFYIFDEIIRGCEIVDRTSENVAKAAKLADFTSYTKTIQGYNKKSRQSTIALAIMKLFNSNDLLDRLSTGWPLRTAWESEKIIDLDSENIMIEHLRENISCLIEAYSEILNRIIRNSVVVSQIWNRKLNSIRNNFSIKDTLVQSGERCR